MTKPPTTGRLLGIDHGLARIGLAVCDTTQLIARHLAIIHRTSKAADFDQLRRHIKAQQVVALVVGIPQDVVREEQGLYSQADKVRHWVGHLQNAILLPIILWDETMTTVDATELAEQLGRKRGQPVDDLAARVMLQSYLDALRDAQAVAPYTSEDMP